MTTRGRKVVPIHSIQQRAAKNDSEIDEFRAVLARDEAAWRRFVARFDEPLREVVRHATEVIEPLDDDQIDDLLGEFWVALLANDMRILRAFDPKRGTKLETWLTFQIAQLATEHVQRLREEPKRVELREAQELPGPPAEQEGIIDLKRQLMSVRQSPEARQAIAEIARDAIESDRPTDDGMLDAEGAAELLAITPAAVRKAASRGSLPRCRVGRKLRFLRSELMAIARR
jgi:excisionase family DNA binding protein